MFFILNILFMKKIRCPKCEAAIQFDETRYEPGRILVFQCPECNKRFKMKLPAAKLATDTVEEEEEKVWGQLVVVENAFHFRQALPLTEGDNVIGRLVRGTSVTPPIKTVDPSVDTAHCAVRVTIGKDGQPKFLLRDVGSQTGTFVQDHLLGLKEQVALADGDIVTIGATTLILQAELAQN